MRAILFCKDGRLYGEPLLVLVAVLLNWLIGENAFTLWFGWWLFVFVLVGVVPIMYGALLNITYGRKYCKEKYPEVVERLESHRTFVLSLCYSFFLYYWYQQL